MSIILDSYTDGTGQFEIAVNYKRIYQSFSPAVTDSLESVKLTLKKANSPTGNCYVKIYAHTGTYGSSSKPTGSVLATSDAFDITTLTTSFAEIEFEFSGLDQINLTSGNYYTWAIEPNATDITDQVIIRRDGSSPTHTGNAGYYDGSNWQILATSDVWFYVYGYSKEDRATAPLPTFHNI